MKPFLGPALKPRVALAAAVALGILLQVYFFAGHVGSDDLGHSHAANRISHGDFDLTKHFQNRTGTHRTGVNFPVAVAFLLFGLNEVSAVLYSFLCSIGSILVVYAIARRWIGEWGAVTAAVLMATAPLAVTYSTILLPAAPLTFFCGLAVWLYLLAEERARGGWIVYFLAGAAVGAAVTVKEPGIQAGVVLAVFYGIRLWRGPRRLGPLMVAVGFMAVFSVELVFWYDLTGDPFYRHYDMYAHQVTHNARLGSIPLATKLDRWKALLSFDGPLGFGIYLTPVALGWALARRRPEAGPCAFWLILYLVVLFLSVAGTSSYQPRRALPVLMPAFILLGGFIVDGPWRRWGWRGPVAVAAVVLAGHALSLAKGNLGYTRESNSNTRAVKEFFDRAGWDRPVWVDFRTYRIMDFLFAFDPPENLHVYPYGKYVYREQPRTPLDQATDSYVVIDRRLVSFLERGGIRFPEIIDRPPPYWRLEKVIHHPTGRSEKHAAIFYIGRPGEAYWSARRVGPPNGGFEEIDGADASVPASWTGYARGEGEGFEWGISEDGRSGRRAARLRYSGQRSAWLVSGKGRQSRPPSSEGLGALYALKQNALYRLEAWVKAIEGSRVHLYFSQFDRDGKKSTSRKSFVLTAGEFRRCVFIVPTGPESVEYRIAVSLQGRGEVRIDEVRLLEYAASSE